MVLDHMQSLIINALQLFTTAISSTLGAPSGAAEARMKSAATAAYTWSMFESVMPQMSPSPAHHEGTVSGALLQLARMLGGLVLLVGRQESLQIRLGLCLRPVLLLPCRHNLIIWLFRLSMEVNCMIGRMITPAICQDDVCQQPKLMGLGNGASASHMVQRSALFGW